MLQNFSRVRGIWKPLRILETFFGQQKRSYLIIFLTGLLAFNNSHTFLSPLKKENNVYKFVPSFLNVYVTNPNGVVLVCLKNLLLTSYA